MFPSLHDEEILECQKRRYKFPSYPLDVLASLSFQQQKQLKGQLQLLCYALKQHFLTLLL